MTNREWLLNKMQNMSDEEFADLIHVPPKMDKEVCDTLGDCFPRECIDCKTNWLKEEQKEKITLSEAERVILENISKYYCYIARDEKGCLFIYQIPPVKIDKRWFCNDTNVYVSSFTMFNHLFQFITWNDSEPYNIEELLKGE